MTDISSPSTADPLSTSPNALPLPGAPTPAPSPAPVSTSPGGYPAPTSSGYDASVGSSGATDGGVGMQLSRIEDKTARIEEKYARSEALLLRMGDRVDAAAGVITSEAARQSDLIALRNEVAALTQRTRGLPGAGTMFVMALLTALLTSAAVIAATRYGIPGVLPPAGQSVAQPAAGSPAR